MPDRPVFTEVDAGSETWLPDINDLFDAIFNSPFPIATFPNEAALPDAALFQFCFAHVEDYDGLYKSNGVIWVPEPKKAASDVAASGWSDSTAQTDFNDLLSKLQAANVIG